MRIKKIANVKKSTRRGGNCKSSHDTSDTINADTIREGGGTEGEAQPLAIVTSENNTRERKATQLKHKLNGIRRRVGEFARIMIVFSDLQGRASRLRMRIAQNALCFLR